MQTAFDYEKWVDEQAKIIGEFVNRLTERGIFDGKVYVFPACGGNPGYLSVLLEQPEDAVDVVWFPGIGTKVAGVPRTELRQKLWQGCRNQPIIPTE